MEEYRTQAWPEATTSVQSGARNKEANKERKKERVRSEIMIKRGRKCLRKEEEINNETKRDREKGN